MAYLTLRRETARTVVPMLRYVLWRCTVPPGFFFLLEFISLSVVSTFMKNKIKQKTSYGSLVKRAKVLQEKKTKGKTLKVVQKNNPISKSFEIKPMDAKINPIKIKGSMGFNISHSEYIFDVKTVAANGTNNINGFNVIKVPINPGLKGPFPWCSQLAPNFETYKIHKFHVTYIPNTTTLATGSLMMAADFDPSDPSPSTKTDMLNKTGVVSGNVFNKLIYSPKKADYNKQKSYYLRNANGTVPGNDDLKFFDCMNLFIAYQGTSPNTTLGEIHIGYDLDFYTPTSDQALVQIGNIVSLVANMSGFGTGNNAGNTNIFGTDFVKNTQSVLGNFSPFNWSTFIDSSNIPYIHFTVTQAVSKVIEFLFTVSAGSFAKTLQARVLQKPTSTNIDSTGITYINDDSYDLDQQLQVLYSAGKDPLANGWTDVSSNNLITWYNWGFLNASVGYYHGNYGFSIDPDQILEFTFGASTGGGTGVTFSRCQLLITDSIYDPIGLTSIGPIPHHV
jgi:hypothetical protein